jgi:hypothetical protein
LLQIDLRDDSKAFRLQRSRKTFNRRVEAEA